MENFKHCFLDFPCPKDWRQGGEMDKNIVHKNSCVIQLSTPSNNTASSKKKESYQLLRRRRKCSNKSIGKKKKKKKSPSIKSVKSLQLTSKTKSNSLPPPLRNPSWIHSFHNPRLAMQHNKNNPKKSMNREAKDGNPKELKNFFIFILKKMDIIQKA